MSAEMSSKAPLGAANSHKGQSDSLVPPPPHPGTYGPTDPTEQIAGGGFAALSGQSDNRTMFAEGEIPGVTATASWKLSCGLVLVGRILVQM